MPTPLDRIEHDLMQHRALYLACIDAGHDGEADFHETCIDALLADWATENTRATA